MMAVAADVLAYGESHGGLVAGELRDSMTSRMRTRVTAVGHLNTHGGDFSRHRGHSNAAHTQGQGDVIGEIGDLRQLHPLGLGKIHIG